MVCWLLQLPLIDLHLHEGIVQGAVPHQTLLSDLLQHCWHPTTLPRHLVVQQLLHESFASATDISSLCVTRTVGRSIWVKHMLPWHLDALVTTRSSLALEKACSTLGQVSCYSPAWSWSSRTVQTVYKVCK